VATERATLVERIRFRLDEPSTAANPRWSTAELDDAITSACAAYAPLGAAEFLHLSYGDFQPGNTALTSNRRILAIQSAYVLTPIPGIVSPTAQVERRRSPLSAQDFTFSAGESDISRAIVLHQPLEPGATVFAEVTLELNADADPVHADAEFIVEMACAYLHEQRLMAPGHGNRDWHRERAAMHRANAEQRRAMLAGTGLQPDDKQLTAAIAEIASYRKKRKSS
jgi:hypothetical protein